jgi:type IV pilus assembly protein PilQ
LKNADLNRLIDTLITLTGHNIIIDNGARGTITGQLVEIDFEKGLKAVFNANGFTLSNIDGIYHVGRMGQAGTTEGQMGRYAVYCRDGLVTIDVKNAPLTNILTTLSDECRLGLVVHGQIAGTVTASYQDKPLADVLGYLLRGTQYSFKKDGDLYFIGDKASEDLYDSRLIQLEHISNVSVIDLIPANVSKGISIKAVKEQNGIIVNGPVTAIMEVESFIRKIDIPPAQVLFEAIVVDYQISDMKNFELYADNTGLNRELPPRVYYPHIDYSAAGDELNFHLNELEDILDISNIGTLSSDFFLRLQIMVEEGIANIRSHPQIAALNGHSASIQIGTSQYYLLESQTIYPSQQTNVSTQTSQRFEVIEADMSLEVTPWVTKSGEIIVEIKPQFNSPATGFDPDVPPTINRRVFESTVRLRDGETIVLGGMIQSQENTTIRKFPILGDIPIIGRLFQNRKSTQTKTELMVYLTPHIYYGAEGSVNIEKILNEDKQ